MYSETREAEHEMLIIMNENQNKHNTSNQSMHSSFCRLHSFKLKHMEFSLNMISPRTFDGDAFQTPENRGIQNRAPTSTPKERGTQTDPEEAPQGPPMNRMYPLNKVPTYDSQEHRTRSYDKDM